MAEIMEQQQNKEANLLLKNFAEFERQAASPDWLKSMRQAGISSFQEQGLPTLKDEDWRFTNVAPITKMRLSPATPKLDESSISTALARAPFSSVTQLRLVFVDGHFSSRHSWTGAFPAGVEVVNLAAALEGHSVVQQHLGRYAVTQGNAFAALNQAFFSDGIFVHVAPGVTVSEPIQVVYVSSGQQSQGSNYPRNLLVAEANSKVTVLETYLSAGKEVCLTNTVTELVAMESASIELLKYQDEHAESFHVATLQGHFGRASSVRLHSFALGARLSRNNIRARLAGEGLECVLNGLYVTRNEQLSDHHMIVEHAEPNCASHEYFNGILDDKSRGVFHGRIFVHQTAQKTDAKQTNKNLLLSDDATANTKPQLEIYADDVKCTHGATVGQLNQEAIFYLRSRGLDTETARRMLIHAFAGEIIERVKCGSAREELDRLVWDRLEANPHLMKRTATARPGNSGPSRRGGRG
jgi:Fe-S cluster assembly protein SufD